MKNFKVNSVNAYNYWAARTIKELRDDVPQAGNAAREFLKLANKNDAQGVALVSFYSQLNSMNGVNVTQIIERFNQKMRQNNALKKQFKLFKHALKEQKYKKTIDKRIVLASNGAVVADGVRPKSLITRGFVLLELGYGNIAKKCKNVTKKLKTFLGIGK